MGPGRPGRPGGFLLHRLLCLTALLCASRGLRLIQAADFNCSQPGIQCTVLDSNCFDMSWIHPFKWTPNAPSHMEVAARIGLNEEGLWVPVLQINWTMNIDSSIRDLQGVEISVLEFSTNQGRCVQFQFGNEFPEQHNQNGQPWQFFYNKFEVRPSEQYHVTVQHLPKKDNVNRKEQVFIVPECKDSEIMQTDTCCRHGHCWDPNIDLEFAGEELIVTFTPRRDFRQYGVQVQVVKNQKSEFQTITLQQEARAKRVHVIFSNQVQYPPCWFEISVWPNEPSCDSGCVRQKYTPTCPTDPEPTTETPGRFYLWSIAAVVTLAVFTVIVSLLYCLRECIHPGPKPTDHTQAPRYIPPPPAKRKVWLVYSADNKRYIDVVIRLADFMRVAWGLDVTLDRHHVQEIGVPGAMAWLSHQKDEVEKENGTILILCSRGAQQKWKAMENPQEPRVTLREDGKHHFGDLFTPALALIVPDFQKAKPYDRYLVAYFGQLFDLGHIPAPLEICPKFALTENLQDLFFRIQKQERYQPNLQLTVVKEEDPSYQCLVRSMERCRRWQERHANWFEKECSREEGEASESSEEEEVVPNNLTRRVSPLLLHCPEISVSMVNPIIKKPDSIMVMDPTIVVGPPSTYVEPVLYETHSDVAILQPLLNVEESTEACTLEPCLVGEDLSLPELNEPFLNKDFSNHPDHSSQSMDLMREAQKKFFYQSFPQGQCVTPSMDFIGTQPDKLSEQSHLNYMEDPCMTSDMDFIGVQPKKLNQQSRLNYMEDPCMTSDMDFIGVQPKKLNQQSRLNYMEDPCMTSDMDFIGVQPKKLNQQSRLNYMEDPCMTSDMDFIGVQPKKLNQQSRLNYMEDPCMTSDMDFIGVQPKKLNQQSRLNYMEDPCMTSDMDFIGVQPKKLNEQSRLNYMVDPCMTSDMDFIGVQPKKLNEQSRLNYMKDPCMTSDMDFIAVQPEELNEQSRLNYMVDPCMTSDIEVQPNKLNEQSRLNYMEDPCMTSDMDFFGAKPDKVNVQSHLNYMVDPCMTSDMDFIGAKPDKVNVQSHLNYMEAPCMASDMDLVRLQTNKLNQQSTDQGYNSWNPNDLEAIKKESLKLFFQNGGLSDFKLV